MRIVGGIPLRGRVEVSGSKNAALPLLVAALLTDQECVFHRIPDLQDVQTLTKLLQEMGVEIHFQPKEHQIHVRAQRIHRPEASYDLVRKMRASVLVLGPLIARFGKAKVSLPGGCAIGTRPINFHLSALEKLGAHIELSGGYVYASSRKLQGARIVFDFPSVGATENLIMAAVLAEGQTRLENAACEPEVVDLVLALRKMGAEIEGEGTAEITIQGKSSLNGCQHEVMGDRIEAGTYLAAGFATGGEVEVSGIDPIHLRAVLDKFEEAGALLTRRGAGVVLKARGCPRAVDLETAPFPGFPTDMQAQFMAIMAVADGVSRITETIFENRFMHVPELMRLGANIITRGNCAVVKGQPKLKAAPLMATDLRASASLIVGALCAEGESWVNRIYHLDRGYEKMELRLQELGADVTRVKG